MSTVITLIFIIINVYEVILLLRVMLSWFRVDPYANPFVRILYNLTEPILEPIREILPQSGMIDFSPLVVFVLLMALQQVLSALI
nr:YggT family protein [Anaerolineae bacterium]